MSDLWLLYYIPVPSGKSTYVYIGAYDTTCSTKISFTGSKFISQNNVITYLWCVVITFKK